MAKPSNRQIPQIMAEDVPQTQIKEGEVFSKKLPSTKWFKKWVPQETVLNNGNCYLMKWATEDSLKVLQEKFQGVEQLPEPDFEVIFLCRYEGCGKIFMEVDSLRKHSQVHVEKQFICNYEGCGRKCLDASKLKQHLLIHNGEKQLMCPNEGCGKKSLPFLERESINPRIVTPTSGLATLDRPFSCPYEGCGKCYKHEYKLNLHLRRGHADSNHGKNGRHTQATDGVDEMGKASEQDEYVEEVGIRNVSGQGKLGMTSKPSSGTSVKRKHSNAAAVDLTVKTSARISMGINELEKGDFQEDGEETEEDHEDTEDDDWGNKMDIEMEEDDDEETEDEMG